MFFRSLSKKSLLNRLVSNRGLQALSACYTVYHFTNNNTLHKLNEFSGILSRELNQFNSGHPSTDPYGLMPIYSTIDIHANEPYEFLYSSAKLESIAETIKNKSKLVYKDVSIFKEILFHAVDIGEENFTNFLQHLGVEACSELVLKDMDEKIIKLAENPQLFTSLILNLNEQSRQALFFQRLRHRRYGYGYLICHIARQSKESFRIFVNSLNPKILTDFSELAIINRYDFIELSRNATVFNEVLKYLNLDAAGLKTDEIADIIKDISENSDELALAFIDKLTSLSSIKAMLYMMQDYSGTLNPVILLKLMGIIFNNPEQIQKNNLKNSFLKSIDIEINGLSKNDIIKPTRYILNYSPTGSIKKPDIAILMNEQPLTSFPPGKMESFVDIAEWEVKGLQGRTILLANTHGDILAIKVQKKLENSRNLIKEYKATHYLADHAKDLDLNSHFPNALRIAKVTGLLTWLKPKVFSKAFKEFKEMVADTDQHTVYMYSIDRSCDYLIYLHDPKITKEAFNKANNIAVHDLFTLLKAGVIFPQLVDMFHKPKLKYTVLYDLIYNNYSGSGMLHAWKEGVEFPNLRPSGLADVGDYVLIDKFISQYQDFNKQIANQMAEYQYVLFLIAGRRGVELTALATTPEEITEIWNDLAKQLLDNCSQALSIITGRTLDNAEQISKSLIDVKRLARQMQYWMTNEYIADVSQGRVKPNIYAKETTVNVRKPYAAFNASLGFSIDGNHSDLGPNHGPEPITEWNEALYWMTDIIFTDYNKWYSELMKVSKNEDNSFNVLTISAMQKQFLLWDKPAPSKQDATESFHEHPATIHKRQYQLLNFFLYTRSY